MADETFAFDVILESAAPELAVDLERAAPSLWALGTALETFHRTRSDQEAPRVELDAKHVESGRFTIEVSLRDGFLSQVKDLFSKTERVTLDAQSLVLAFVESLLNAEKMLERCRLGIVRPGETTVNDADRAVALAYRKLLLSLRRSDLKRVLFCLDNREIAVTISDGVREDPLPETYEHTNRTALQFVGPSEKDPHAWIVSMGGSETFVVRVNASAFDELPEAQHQLVPNDVLIVDLHMTQHVTHTDGSPTLDANIEILKVYELRHAGMD